MQTAIREAGVGRRIHSNSPFSYSNHRPAKPKIPKPLVYAQVSPLGTSFATP